MGVYINTEMPKEGTVFVIDSAGQVWSNEWPTRGYIRLDGVTAIPVPPHGRLIDADAIEVISYREIPQGCEDTFDSGVMCLLEQIDLLPTIIPAEEGE